MAPGGRRQKSMALFGGAVGNDRCNWVGFLDFYVQVSWVHNLLMGTQSDAGPSLQVS